MKRTTAYVASDYTYTSHAREVNSIVGVVSKGNRKSGLKRGDAFSTIFPARVLQNDVNGKPRTYTVLDATGKAVVRLEARLTSLY